MQAAGRTAQRRSPAAIIVDYPEAGSLFPPEITPPTILWRDSDRSATEWRIDVSFADGSASIHARSKGEHLRVGNIDPDCVAPTNEPPKLDSPAGGGAVLGTGARDVGDHQTALHFRIRHANDCRDQRRKSRPSRVARARHNQDFK